MIGQKLAHYEITASLGKGGMGEVWRARDTRLGREVAIKTLPSALAQDLDRLARFEREAKLLAALNHSHIAAVYGLDEHEGTRFLAMELIEGQTLAERLESGPLPAEDALRLALQIAEALEAAHSKGVVHRDLKPANAMLTRDGVVKVLDFGLAKAFAGNPQEASPAHSPALSIAMTQAGIILGTAGYMSPEQASGQATDQRADVWAFGVVVYEMLTGLPLFTGESVPHILAGILRTDPDWNRLPQNLHPRLRLMLERCLAKRPRDRYHSIADARVDIEAVLADPEGAALRPAFAAASAAQPFWRRGLPVAATILVIAVAAGSGAWLYLRQPPDPVVRFDFALGAGQQLRNIGRDAVAISADGTQIVYNTTAGLYLRTLGEFEGRLIPGTEAPLTSPFFSPDGEWVGFYDGQLKKIRTAGGTAIVISAATNPQGASFSSDGATILFGQPAGIMEVSANGGTAALVVAADGDLWDPQYLPDGSILFTRFTSAGVGEIIVFTPATGERTALFPGERAIYAPSGHLVTTDPAAAPNALFARAFDLKTRTAGAPLLVAENVQFAQGKTQYAIAASGALVYAYGEAVPGAGGSVLPDLNLTLVDRDGNRRVLEAPGRPYRSPRVSPDGSQVAVEIVGSDQKSSIWVYDLSGEADIRRLTQVTEGSNLRPTWSADGQRLAFSSDRDGPASIYWQPADGSAPAERLTTAEQGTLHLPESFSLEGALSFALLKGGFGAATWGIWARDSKGEIGEFHDLEAGNQFGSAFSPDGQWLAYASAETSTNQDEFRIYVERYPKTGERYEVVGGGATWPVWSADGTELFYRRGFTPEARELRSVKVLGSGPGFRYSTDSSVSVRGFTTYQSYRDFDPLRDGTGWIMLTALNDDGASPTDQAAAPEEPARIRVVLNWFEELKQRVPAQR